MKRIAFVIIFILIFSLPVNAQSGGENYSSLLKDSNAEDLYEALPRETRDFLSENGITLDGGGFAENITAENVFKHIFSLFKSGFKKPIAACAVVLGIIIISSALSGLGQGKTHDIALYTCAIATVSALIAPIYGSITAAVNALKGLSVFMLSFVPIFSGIIAAAGGTLTAVSSSGVLLLAAEGLSTLSSFIILPLMGGCLSLNIGVACSPLIENSGIASAVKKIVIWGLSLTSTVFLGVLEIQTALNSAGDSVNMRTAKFILGSTVPVAGTVLSEAVTTVTASLSLLKTTVAIYGIVAVCAILLPIIAELLLWRLCLTVIGCCCELFSVGKVATLAKSLDEMLSILIATVLLCAVLFVISITVIISLTGNIK